MTSVFCTIISKSHLPFAKALASSLWENGYNHQLHTLVVDEETDQQDTQVRIYNLSSLKNLLESPDDIYPLESDALRWALKPVWIQHLLKSFEKVIYVDADISFFGSPSFLFDLLDSASILLTPHRAPLDPFQYPNKFTMNFVEGLYNAGFVGASRRAGAALEWWARACRFRTDRDVCHGFMVDQRYLDLIPVIDPHTQVLSHLGCNLGSWNVETCIRMRGAGGEVLINAQFPIVFIHFNHETIRHISNGNDPLLEPYLSIYKRRLLKAGSAPATGPFATQAQTTIMRAKSHLKIRTRLKRVIYKIYERL